MTTEFTLTLKNEENKKLNVTIVNGNWEMKPNEDLLTDFVHQPSQIIRLAELVPKIINLLAVNGLKSIELKEEK